MRDETLGPPKPTIALRNLSRSRDGLTVHSTECRYATSYWEQADQMTDDELKRIMEHLRICGVCGS